MAIVGMGKISQSSHLPAVVSSGLVELRAIVDPGVDRVRALVDERGLEARVCSDVNEIIGEIDCAIIATPNHLHREIAVTCLENGISVLIEKPLATTLADGEAILQAAKTPGTKVAVGYCTRFRHNVRFLRDLLGRNYFGRVTRFYHQFGTTGGWTPVSGYILDPSQSGGGVLAVTATHFLDRMIFLFGEPDTVGYWDDSNGGPEANCRAAFHYDSAAGSISGFATYSKTTALPAVLVLDCEGGIVVLADRDDARVEFYPRDGSGAGHEISPVLARDISSCPTIFDLQLADFVHAIVDDTEPFVSGTEGIRSQKVLENLYAGREELRSHWYPDSHRNTHSD